MSIRQWQQHQQNKWDACGNYQERSTQAAMDSWHLIASWSIVTAMDPPRQRPPSTALWNSADGQRPEGRGTQKLLPCKHRHDWNAPAPGRNRIDGCRTCAG